MPWWNCFPHDFLFLYFHLLIPVRFFAYENDAETILKTIGYKKEIISHEGSKNHTYSWFILFSWSAAHLLLLLKKNSKMKISIEDAEWLIREHYSLQVETNSLNGYDDQNFLLTATDGTKYILKIAGHENHFLHLKMQHEMMQHLADSPLASFTQEYIPAKNGDAIINATIKGQQVYARVLTYLEGEFWVDVQSKSTTLYENLGSFVGNMDLHLKDFFHPAAERYHEWDISNAADAEKNLPFITDHEKRRIAAYYLLQFKTEVIPVLTELRHACIHNDANDYNILVKDSKIAGLIDFGDTVYTALINNLAIACAYAMLHLDDPIEKAAWIVKGYHHAFPLEEKEIHLLYYLIATRLCISVTQSAKQSALGSGNEHHFLSEQPAWKLLYQLLQTNPIKAENSFRIACGFPSIIQARDDYKSILHDRHEHLGRNLSISYQKPLKIIRGALQYLYDDKGNTYIDCVNNVSHAGHCHPSVVKALQKQAAILNTNTRYLSDLIVEYSKRLTAKLPPELSVCYFTNSGSEANDLAIRIARQFTQQKDIVVLDHAYHGTSTLAIEMSPYKFDGRGGSGRQPYIHKAISPDLFRGPFQYGDKKAGEKYAADVLRILQELKSGNKKPAAFICETLLGVGGQIPLPEGYLKKVYEYVRSFDGICIADEVQVGFGRVGKSFWGFQLQDVIPDMVVMGKPIGNGHPLAAVVMTEKLASAFDNGMEYFNTFGGNPVSMATGLAVLEVIEHEEMQKHALDTGAILLDKLRKLMDQYPIIGDVRGTGLFVGVELVKNRVTKEPAVPEIDEIVERMKDRGYLLSTDGPLHNVLKIKPPMVFNKENAERLVTALDEILTLTCASTTTIE